MKKFIAGLLVVIGVVAPIAAYAEYYKVSVTRVDQDLYKTDSGLYIVTQYCYEYAYSGAAVLKYERSGYDNKLIFDSGTSCGVKKVFK